MQQLRLLKWLLMSLGLAVLAYFVWQLHGSRNPSHQTTTPTAESFGVEARQAYEQSLQQIIALDNGIGQVKRAIDDCQHECEELQGRVEQMQRAVTQRTLRMQRLELLLASDHGAELSDGRYIAPPAIVQQAEWERARCQTERGELAQLEELLAHSASLKPVLHERQDTFQNLRFAVERQCQQLKQILEHVRISAVDSNLDQVDLFEIEHDLVRNDFTIRQLLVGKANP